MHSIADGLHHGRLGVVLALASALLFGASTPFAKLLVGRTPALWLASLLYLGSGFALTVWIALHSARRRFQFGLARGDWGWLAAATFAGGVLGPVLLLTGLAATPANTASLLLNLEGVFTALLAWVVFREHTDRRLVVGMLLIVAGGFALTGSAAAERGALWPALAIVGACLAWGLDNNLTRKIAGGDAALIAAVKGWVAGGVNAALALSLGLALPALATGIAAAAVGAAGYGASLVCFVLALRHLGAARTGAYFSIAPFVGALVALPLLGESLAPLAWLAAALMGAGLWLHLTERHEHEHVHEPLTHTHAHRHDEHHAHPHDESVPAIDPLTGEHVHEHAHERLVHRHPHYPDLHHRHSHP
ncbi:MAG: DMT family transporter [Burkholderiaceae bacterium]